jgi:hypothetical protein
MTKLKHPTHASPPRSANPTPWEHGLLILVLACLLLAILATTTSASPAPRAHTARTVNATDTANLRYIKHSGSQLLEEGAAQGTLPGTMHARASLGATFTASFTIYTHGGTITGHGTATPHGSGLDESFAGTLTVTGGTGRYSHAHGHASFSGTFNRRTYAIVLKTKGSLSY